jgi:soluble lytic murein transglycosylase
LSVLTFVGWTAHQLRAEPAKAAVPDKAPSADGAKVSPATPAETRDALSKPVASTPAERDHWVRLDEALKPVRDYPLAEADATRIRDAVKAISGGDVAKGNEIKSQVKDPVGIKFIEWVALRSGFGTPAEYQKFLSENPSWPDRSLLVARMEDAMFTQGGSATTIKSYFAKSPPQTGAGWAALASAHLIEGDEKTAKMMAAKAWRDHSLPAALETGFLERFGKFLSVEDHKWRLDRLLIDDLRWANERNQRAAVIRRVIPLLPADEQKKAEARLSLLLGSKKPVAGPAGSKEDWGHTFHRIQGLRRAGKLDEARKLLLAAPTDPQKIVNPDEWWVERRQNAYGALKQGKPKVAYELVKDAGPLSVNPLKEQTFMAGWLALRYLKDPKLAEAHFLAMQKAADGPLSRAKAAYWLGRTAEARKDMPAALEHYRTAVLDGDTFHGLLARQKLEPGRQPILVKAPQEPSQAETDRFVASDAVKAVIIAKKSSVDPALLRNFIVHLRSVFSSEAELALVAHLSESIGDTQMAVRTGKAAIAERKNLLYYAYPVHSFPSYTPLRTPPETAFLLGIARQETEFNKTTVSGAGAKGLLQVMPVTAKHVCSVYKVKCDIPRLLSDTSYNAMMASAYIGDRLEEFSGSYVLTLAGYNAGPGRAREWIREFGDPRDPNVDPIDWIERIPIQETREYVAKVLANVQIYRARLGQEGDALRLEEDLNRSRRVASER